MIELVTLSCTILVDPVELYKVQISSKKDKEEIILFWKTRNHEIHYVSDDSARDFVKKMSFVILDD